MKKSFVLPALALGLCGFASAAEAAVTLDFGAESCSFGSGAFCGVLQNYGDTEAVDVSYRTINKKTGTATQQAFVYGSGYGDLANVLFAGSNRTDFIGEVTLAAREGYAVSLLGFDFASFQNLSPNVPLLVTDLAGTVLFSGSPGTGGARGHGTLALTDPKFFDGIVIRWGPDSYDVGLDNIRYETRSLLSAGAVPEPTSWAMMIGGFALVGGALRSSRRRGLALVAR